jgi:hypothetical protein
LNYPNWILEIVPYVSGDVGAIWMWRIFWLCSQFSLEP